MKLQRDAVVRAALGLLNEVGVEGLTTRRLAEELGVKSPALYWHFESKRVLLDAMAEAMLAEHHTETVPPPGADWRAWLAANARSFRRALLAYRDGARIHAGTRPSKAQFTAIEAQARLLHDAGFPPAEALRALICLGRYTVGFVLEEQAEGGEEHQGPPDVPAKEFPILAAGMKALGGDNEDGSFEFGLRLLITGLETSLKQGSAKPPPVRKGRRR
jgi:TetR/AcrR family tetracycline transcriptional repressor